MYGSGVRVPLLSTVSTVESMYGTSRRARNVSYHPRPSTVVGRCAMIVVGHCPLGWIRRMPGPQVLLFDGSGSVPLTRYTSPARNCARHVPPSERVAATATSDPETTRRAAFIGGTPGPRRRAAGAAARPRGV